MSIELKISPTDSQEIVVEITSYKMEHPSKSVMRPQLPLTASLRKMEHIFLGAALQCATMCRFSRAQITNQDVRLH